MEQLFLNFDITAVHVAAVTGTVFVLLSPVGRTLRRIVYRLCGLKARWKRLLKKEVPTYHRLPTELKRKLEASTNIFLHEVRIKGYKRSTVTEKEKVMVAAHACILLLGWRRSCYNGIRQVLIYPSDISTKSLGSVAKSSKLPKLISGLWRNDGTIRLSLEAAKYGAALPYDGNNVVFHEFAHELDSLYGFSGGITAPDSNVIVNFFRTWLFRRELKKLRHAKQQESAVISDYGTTNQAELFACATEGFFERPADLKSKHPAIYNRLQKIYRLDPAAW